MKYFKIAALAVAGSLLFTACSKSKDEVAGGHQIEVRMTDAPFDAEEVNVDIQRVQVRFNDNVNETWVDLTPFAGVHNLLALQNGIDIAIASGVVPPPQNYVSEIRLILGDNNSIKIAGVLMPLKVPSGSESGLKIKINKTLVDPVTTFLIDFDAGLSVHQTGNGSFILQPVVKLK